MLEPPSDGFHALIRKVTVDRGFGCASYKEKCLRRRIAVRMRARGALSYQAYGQLLDRDAGEYDRLIDVLTINVTKFFRNWEVWAKVAALVVPDLWSQDLPAVHVWSAGCSSGEEAYSLAILFHQHAVATGTPSRLERVAVLGTDIDRTSLAAAHTAAYEESDFADTPMVLRRRYFAATLPFSPVQEIRDMVRFERRDLLSDSAPPGSHQIVVCRNALIYFDRETQERLFDVFLAALAPGGFLVLGKVESLLGRVRARFAPVDARERIFRKL